MKEKDKKFAVDVNCRYALLQQQPQQQLPASAAQANNSAASAQPSVTVATHPLDTALVATTAVSEAQESQLKEPHLQPAKATETTEKTEKTSATSSTAPITATTTPSLTTTAVSTPAAVEVRLKKVMNIPIGDVRIDADYERHLSASFVLPSSYLKYHRRIEAHDADPSTEYVLDKKDQAWIKSLQAGVGALPRDLARLLTADVLEAIFNLLERYTAQSKDPIPLVHAQQLVLEKLPTSTSTSTHLDATSAQRLLPAVYEYWLQKRQQQQQQQQKPQLCRKYWPQVNSADTNPHSVFRARDKEKYRLRKQQKRNDIESFRKMQQLRREFSRAQTLLQLILERESLREAEFLVQREIFDEQILMLHGAPTNQQSPAATATTATAETTTTATAETTTTTAGDEGIESSVPAAADTAAATSTETTVSSLPSTTISEAAAASDDAANSTTSLVSAAVAAVTSTVPTTATTTTTTSTTSTTTEATTEATATTAAATTATAATSALLPIPLPVRRQLPFRYSLKFEQIVYPPQPTLEAAGVELSAAAASSSSGNNSKKNHKKILNGLSAAAAAAADGSSANGNGNSLLQHPQLDGEKRKHKKKDRNRLQLFVIDSSGNKVPISAAAATSAELTAAAGTTPSTTATAAAAAELDPRKAHALLEGPKFLCQPQWPSFLSQQAPWREQRAVVRSVADYRDDLEFKSESISAPTSRFFRAPTAVATTSTTAAISTAAAVTTASEVEELLLPSKFRARCRIGRGGRMVMDRIPIYTANPSSSSSSSIGSSAAWSLQVAATSRLELQQQSAVTYLQPTSLSRQHPTAAYKQFFGSSSSSSNSSNNNISNGSMNMINGGINRSKQQQQRQSAGDALETQSLLSAACGSDVNSSVHGSGGRKSSSATAAAVGEYDSNSDLLPLSNFQLAAASCRFRLQRKPANNSSSSGGGGSSNTNSSNSSSSYAAAAAALGDINSSNYYAYSTRFPSMPQLPPLAPAARRVYNNTTHSQQQRQAAILREILDRDDGEEQRVLVPRNDDFDMEIDREQYSYPASAPNRNKGGNHSSGSFGSSSNGSNDNINSSNSDNSSNSYSNSSQTATTAAVTAVAGQSSDVKYSFRL